MNGGGEWVVVVAELTGDSGADDYDGGANGGIHECAVQVRCLRCVYDLFYTSSIL